MNKDIILDLLKILKSKKCYGTFEKLRVHSFIIHRNSGLPLSPTIFEFNFNNHFRLELSYFLIKGIATIFWGDNSVERYYADNPMSLVHHYEKGTYKIKIFPENIDTEISSEYFYGGICSNMTNLIKIGNNFRNLSNLFSKCDINIYLNHLDLSNVKKVFRMFNEARYFNQQIGDWDVSNINNTSGMFFLAFSFNQDIGEWDVSNVVAMRNMFHGARSFNQPIGNWDVSNVEDMKSMFEGTRSFDQPLTDWNVSKTKYMCNMFERALSFNQPIGNWDVSNVEDMDSMFEGAESFDQPLANWNVSKVKYMRSMFERALSFNQPVVSWNWKVRCDADLRFMFNQTYSLGKPRNF